MAGVAWSERKGSKSSSSGGTSSGRGSDDDVLNTSGTRVYNNYLHTVHVLGQRRAVGAIDNDPAHAVSLRRLLEPARQLRVLASTFGCDMPWLGTMRCVNETAPFTLVTHGGAAQPLEQRLQRNVHVWPGRRATLILPKFNYKSAAEPSNQKWSGTMHTKLWLVELKGGGGGSHGESTAPTSRRCVSL
jgi:hypothetical protein